MTQIKKNLKEENETPNIYFGCSIYKTFDESDNMIHSEIDNSASYDCADIYFKENLQLTKHIKQLKKIESIFKNHGIQIGYTLGVSNSKSY